VGKEFALTAARAGADILLHYGGSADEASHTADEIHAIGRQVWLFQANLANPQQTRDLFDQAWQTRPFNALVNNAAIFEPLDLAHTGLDAWQQHLAINLTAPFLLSQAFGAALPANATGRIVNILDWRALRPGGDHFPYTISKAALAALTQALAVALAPAVTVNGLALGAILPPADGGNSDQAIASVPAHRWAKMEELGDALVFLLSGPAYITGEIIHLDGGRHLI
jgi:NAD(P)-dependent dehydrogenase (short-subunit alcohol dehydrogenase family)